MPRLVELLRASGDGPLQVSALWAVKNLVRKASKETKCDVVQCVGWSELLACVRYVFLVILRLLIGYIFCLYFIVTSHRINFLTTHIISNLAQKIQLPRRIRTRAT